MKFSLTRRIQDTEFGGQKYQYGDLTVTDADSIEQLEIQMDLLMNKYREIIDGEASGRAWGTPLEMGKKLAEKRSNKEEVKLEDIPF